jgi:aryl sulfotransferase
MNQRGGIVWLASFPKSGNTWFRIFLANLAAGDKGPADINDLDEKGGIASSRHEFEAATLLDSGLLSHDDIDSLRPLVYRGIAAETTEQRWIKVHDAYSLNPAGEPILGRGVAQAAIYLVRDPRDVAVSLAYHNSTTIDAAIDLMNAANGALCRGRQGLAPQLRQRLMGWSGHVASWLDQADIPVHRARYEDLVADPAEYFEAALVFAGRAASPAEIERAVRHASFAELQRQENAQGFAERMSRSAPFFRTGRVGGWRDALLPEQVARIEQAHGAMMRRLGYEVSAAVDRHAMARA